MTREEAGEWAALLQAYADGAEVINVSNEDVLNRTEFDELGLAPIHSSYCVDYWDYRIKPQDKDRCYQKDIKTRTWAGEPCASCRNNGVFCRYFKEAGK